MDMQTFIKQRKEMYNELQFFLDNSNEDYFDHQNYIDYLKNNVTLNKSEDLLELLRLLTKISNNHHRSHKFIEKIEQILLFLKDKINQFLSPEEVISIFQKNKKVLFYVQNYILNFSENKRRQDDICEIKFKKNKKKTKNKIIIDDVDYIKKIQIGENDSKICYLIRENLAKEFISYTNQINLNLSSTIEPSKFETNDFLLYKSPTLIEYAAFFGSIEIFQYLIMNQVDLRPSLWLYAIHSNNAELFNLLKKYDVPIDQIKYEDLLEESIKCHHNAFADYFLVNFLDNDKNIEIKTFILGINYSNYYFFPDEINESHVKAFYTSCKQGFLSFVEIFIDEMKQYIDPDELLHVVKESENCALINILLKSGYVGFEIFRNWEILKEISTPSFIETIEKMSFMNCTSLTHVTIHSNVTKIGSSSFKNCENLIEIDFGKESKLEVFEDSLFQNCTSLVNIKIPSSVISIGDYCFCNCALKQITIPSSVTCIGKNAFKECKYLAQVTILSSSISIGPNCFSKCSSLEQVASIDKYSFKECESLNQITILPKLKTIEQGCFIRCLSLTYVIIPSSVTSIENEAFRGCSSLKEITIPSSVTSIGSYSFFECLSLAKIEISSSVIEIKKCSFSLCISLETISFSSPSSLKIISEGSFFGCSSLKEISFPNSVIDIGEYAFADCSSLAQISFENSSSEVKIRRYAFTNCPAFNQSFIQSHQFLKFEKDVFLNLEKFEKHNIKTNTWPISTLDIFKVVNKETGEAFVIKTYSSNIFNDLSSFLCCIQIFNSNNSGFVKIHNFHILQSDFLYDDDVLNKFVKEGVKYILICEYMANDNIEFITYNYLNSGRHKIMNRTIQSKIIYGIAAQMQYLHENHIILQNLSISNIYLDDNQEPKIGSFSNAVFFAKPLENTAGIKTPSIYQAPEIYFCDGKTYDQSIDVYAYGILLIRILSHSSHFDHDYINKYISLTQINSFKSEAYIPYYYSELINECLIDIPEKRPTFEKLTEFLKNELYELDGNQYFGNLEVLHSYINRIDKFNNNNECGFLMEKFNDNNNDFPTHYSDGCLSDGCYFDGCLSDGDIMDIE